MDEEFRVSCRTSVSLHGEGISERSGYQHRAQARQAEGTDVAVNLGQHSTQVIPASDLADILLSAGNHQVIGQVKKPTRSGARHAD